MVLVLFKGTGFWFVGVGLWFFIYIPVEFVFEALFWKIALVWFWFVCVGLWFFIYIPVDFVFEAEVWKIALVLFKGTGTSRNLKEPLGTPGSL